LTNKGEYVIILLLIIKEGGNMYKIISGIFEGKEFNGSELIINGEKRIWDNDSFGRNYPIENCEVI